MKREEEYPVKVLTRFEAKLDPLQLFRPVEVPWHSRSCAATFPEQCNARPASTSALQSFCTALHMQPEVTPMSPLPRERRHSSPLMMRHSLETLLPALHPLPPYKTSSPHRHSKHVARVHLRPVCLSGFEPTNRGRAVPQPCISPEIIALEITVHLPQGIVTPVEHNT
ncbi:predicted protein [Coccidioides posadasii str. Silveira]|uniref:Predicted protein n=2 Tax=Coccidioides posadasii TaxID=199306 RepID=E9CYK6_COCPS|nr:predicted protein [Coccidioides posadasii str. Silveira]KMM66753.1 hypothetical protein CPAG_03091 [Coccidioides posadasii RMSCC 3488]